MKINSSSLLLKIAILISALIGTGIVVANFVNLFQIGLFFKRTLTGVTACMLTQHIVLSALYLVMAFYLYKLVGGTSNREIICRKNLTSVKRILYVLFALLITRLVFALIFSSLMGPGRFNILFAIINIVGSTWELWIAALVIYVLAVVFERAVNLKEEQALTI
jgi:Protein of unknown function (DUF2975)